MHSISKHNRNLSGMSAYWKVLKGFSVAEGTTELRDRAKFNHQSSDRGRMWENPPLVRTHVRERHQSPAISLSECDQIRGD